MSEDTQTFVPRRPFFICSTLVLHLLKEIKSYGLNTFNNLSLVGWCAGFYRHFKTLFRRDGGNCPTVSDYRNSLSWKQFKKHFDPHRAGPLVRQPQSHDKGKFTVFAPETGKYLIPGIFFFKVNVS